MSPPNSPRFPQCVRGRRRWSEGQPTDPCGWGGLSRELPRHCAERGEGRSIERMESRLSPRLAPDSAELPHRSHPRASAKSSRPIRGSWTARLVGRSAAGRPGPFTAGWISAFPSERCASCEPFFPGIAFIRSRVAAFLWIEPDSRFSGGKFAGDRETLFFRRFAGMRRGKGRDRKLKENPSCAKIYFLLYRFREMRQERALPIYKS
jgi:hypothetical protein